MQIYPERLSAVDAAEAIKSGQLTVTDLAAATLERIDARCEVQAWAYLNKEHVMSEAKSLDAIPTDERKSALFGVTVAVKDNYYSKDMPTQFGSERYKGHMAPIDATIVAVLRAAGCLIIGKTSLQEFAFQRNPTSQQPPTRNPHDIKRSPGASSSGSAAAVADFQAMVAIGTQTAASITNPASFCGTYGWKPSKAMISLQGALLAAPSFDTPGFFAREVKDLQAVASVFGIERQPKSKQTAAQPAMIGCFKSDAWDKASSGAHRVYLLAIECLQKAGIECKEIPLPEEFTQAVEACRLVGGKEFSMSIQGEIARGYDGLTSGRRKDVEDGNAISWTEYKEARAMIAKAKQSFQNIVSEFPILMTLSASSAAPETPIASGDDSFARIWTALQVPTISVPGLGDDENGNMPVGIQLIGAEFDDVNLLELAKTVGDAFKKFGNWHSKL